MKQKTVINFSLQLNFNWNFYYCSSKERVRFFSAVSHYTVVVVVAFLFNLILTDEKCPVLISCCSCYDSINSEFLHILNFIQNDTSLYFNVNIINNTMFTGSVLITLTATILFALIFHFLLHCFASMNYEKPLRVISAVACWIKILFR